MAKLMKDYSKHSLRYDLVEIPEEREVRILLSSLQVLNDQLGKTKFLVGNEPTIADIAIATEIEQVSTTD